MARDIGIITEQNDLGLGFDTLNPKDQLAYAEATAKQEENKSADDKKDN